MVTIGTPSASTEEHEDEEMDASVDASEEIEEQEGGTGADAAAKKRKKKKKKKKHAGDAAADSHGESSTGSGSEAPAGPSSSGGSSGGSGGGGKEHDRRLQRALSSIRGGEDMWVLLGGAGLGDADVAQLVDPLRSSPSVTSVDLSGNRITGDGLKALVSALSDGAAPELISLDLRGNELGDDADEALAALHRARKQLTVEVGPLAPGAGGDAGGGAQGASGGGGGGGAQGGKRRGAVKKLQQQKAAAEAEQRAAAQAAAEQQARLLLAQQRQAAAAANGGAAAAGGSGGGAGGSGSGDDFRQSPMFRRFFMAGNSDAPDAQPNTDSDEEGEGEMPDITPEEIWGKVQELLPAGAASIPALGEVLRTAAGCLEGEMEGPPPADPDCGASSSSSGSGGGGGGHGQPGGERGGEGGGGGSGEGEGGSGGGGAGAPARPVVTEAPPDAAATTEAAAGARVESASGAAGPLGGLQRHTRAAAEQLGAIKAVLAIQPPPVLTQFSPDPQPALGTHRLWAADVLTVLLLAGHPSVDAAVAASGALPEVMALALALDKCSALHFRALQMLHCAVKSGAPGLWRGLFEPGMGAGADAGAARAAGGGGGDRLREPLHVALARIASESAGKPMGQRPGRAGFAAKAAQVLLAACGSWSPDPGPQDLANSGGRGAGEGDVEPPAPRPAELDAPNAAALAEALSSGGGAWAAAVAPGGALAALLEEQDGELCGPRPARAEAASDDGGDGGGALAGGGLITGEQLLAMLQDMGGFSTTTEGG